jgi:hypothetical protein
MNGSASLGLREADRADRPDGLSAFDRDDLSNPLAYLATTAGCPGACAKPS